MSFGHIFYLVIPLFFNYFVPVFACEWMLCFFEMKAL